jgi:hypothetical protein
MIKIENTEVTGWQAAIRGMRNPMNSWDKSDSVQKDNFDYDKEENIPVFFVGKNDLQLMKQLVKAGTDHSKFMRMITVTCDITAPRYWWTEFDTYKIGTVRNSCSTMHKIHAKPFEHSDFSWEHIFTIPPNPDKDVIKYRDGDYVVFSKDILDMTIDMLNLYRQRFLETKDKEYWWQMIQLLPQSYNQRATIQMNYAVLRNMYHGRQYHKVDDWREGFCQWVESLPYSELITDNAKEGENNE